MNLKKINQYIIISCLIAFCVSEQQECSGLHRPHTKSSEITFDNTPVIEMTPDKIEKLAGGRGLTTPGFYSYYKTQNDAYHGNCRNKIGIYDFADKSFTVLDNNNGKCKQFFYDHDNKLEQTFLKKYCYSPDSFYDSFGDIIYATCFDENGKIVESHNYAHEKLVIITKNNPTNNSKLSITCDINSDPEKQGIGSYQDPRTNNKKLSVKSATYTSTKGKQLALGSRGFIVANDMLDNPGGYSPHEKNKFSGKNYQKINYFVNRHLIDKETVVAWHESGHALTEIKKCQLGCVEKITIKQFMKPDGKIDGGSVLLNTFWDSHKMPKEERVKKSIIGDLAGAAAEQILFNEPIPHKNYLFGYLQEPRFAGDMQHVEGSVKKLQQMKQYQSGSELDIVYPLYQETYDFLENNKPSLRRLATEVKKKETLTGEQVYNLFGQSKPVFNPDNSASILGKNKFNDNVQNRVERTSKRKRSKSPERP